MSLTEPLTVKGGEKAAVSGEHPKEEPRKWNLLWLTEPLTVKGGEKAAVSGEHPKEEPRKWNLLWSQMQVSTQTWT